MQRSVLIAGAGYLGQALALALLARKDETRVHVLRRRAEHPPGTLLTQADLLQPQTLSDLPYVTHIVYCAAADGGSEEAYQAIYEEGLRNLLSAYALRKGESPPHVIYSSSTSVYAARDGEWVDEASTLVGSGPSRFLVAGEKLLESSPFPSTVLRFGGIYGPGRGSFLERIRAGTERLSTGAPQYTNRIHRDDCVGLILWLLGQSARAGLTVYNAVDCESCERNEVIRWLAAQAGIDPSKLQATRDAPRSQLRGNKRVSNKKLLDAGYRFIYPSFRQGYLPLLLQNDSAF